MFSWYKYLIDSLFFSSLGFWSGNLFLIVSFPDRCLLVPFYVAVLVVLCLVVDFLCCLHFMYVFIILDKLG